MNAQPPAQSSKALAPTKLLVTYIHTSSIMSSIIYALFIAIILISGNNLRSWVGSLDGEVFVPLQVLVSGEAHG